MHIKSVPPVFYWKPQSGGPDLIASALSTVSLPAPLTTTVSAPAQDGNVILGRVKQVNPAYPLLETLDGRELGLKGSEVILGVLGVRKALRGFSGKLPSHLKRGMILHLLNKGGVIGECTAFHRDLGWPTTVEYLGTVCRSTRPLNLRDDALPVVETALPELPLVMVLGTCMNAGKTSVCKQIIQLFSQKGFRVHAGKVSGVACWQDLLAMKSGGAQRVLSFQDFGLASTAQLQNLVPVARSLVHHLSQPQPDFTVLEMGDGILGGYHVASLFDDGELMNRSVCTILCANDLMGAWGGIEWMSRKGQRPSLISGPVTDSAEGIQYIEENWHIPAANAFDCAGKIGTLILESLMPWLKSA